MRNHLFVFLVVLIFSTSFNPSHCEQGQQFRSTREGEKLKANDRRASGLMAYPRIGRSDLPVSSLNFNRHHDVQPDTEFQLYNSDFDSPQDKDYEGEISLKEPSNLAVGYTGRSMNLKHMDKTPKEPSWLFSDRLRSVKDYRPWQKIDEGRTLYPNSLPLIRGSRNSQLNSYTPRLGREDDIERVLCK